MKTITVTTKKKNELYEYAKNWDLSLTNGNSRKKVTPIFKRSRKCLLRWTGKNTMFNTSSIIASTQQESTSCL